jgi:hypothetical protein
MPVTLHNHYRIGTTKVQLVKDMLLAPRTNRLCFKMHLEAYNIAGIRWFQNQNAQYENKNNHVRSRFQMLNRAIFVARVPFLVKT